MNKKLFIFIVSMVMEILPSFAMDYTVPHDQLPYQLIRFLQNVFDDSAKGNYSPQSAIDDIVKAVGTQLHATNMDVFTDKRNLDAIIIYTIISDNHSVLEELVARDTLGYFNIPIVHALKKYFAGDFQSSINDLNTIKDSDITRRIEPYVYMLMGNIMMRLSFKEAIKVFDHVRLISPGTILEEISLRNLLEISLNQGMEKNSFKYIRNYTRQFHHSLYKDYFINLLLRFLLSDKLKLPDNNDIIYAISFLDFNDQRIIYFTIARHAVIAEKHEIGMLAIKQLSGMKNKLDYRDIATIWLYLDLINIPIKDDITSAQLSLYAIPDSSLMPRDRILKKYSEIALEDMSRVSLDTHGDILDKDLILEEIPHEKIYLELESFIQKKRKKIEEIDYFLEEKINNEGY